MPQQLSSQEQNANLCEQSDDDLLVMLLDSTHTQVTEKQLSDPLDRLEFELGCDALNLWRIRWRIKEESGEGRADEILEALTVKICEHRRYEIEEFQLAIAATKDRARLPFGFGPLQYAFFLAKKNPIQLLDVRLRSIELANQIASIALQLDAINNGKKILLPMEALRKLLGCRKLSVSGAIRLLMQNGVLADLDNPVHTGKAREFKFIGRENTDYKKHSAAETKPNL